MITQHKVTGHKVGVIDTDNDIKIRNNHELRWYDDGNYVGFEAPALSADQIWTLPNADGTSGQVLRTDGSGVLSWASAAAGSGQVELDDTDASHQLIFDWLEDDSADRTLTWKVHAGNRTIDLNESFTVVDGQNIELHGSGGEKAQLAIDTQNAERTLNLTGNLTLAGNLVTQNNNLTINAVDAARTLTLTENFTIGGGSAGTLTYSAGSKTLTVADNCTVNQDVQTTDSPTFAGLTLNGTVTAGSDGTGHDILFYSATANDYWKWDESADAVVHHMTMGETTAGETAHKITVVDPTTASAGMHRAFVVDYSTSGAKTGTSYCAGINVDVTVADTDSGAVTQIYGITSYITPSGTPTIATVVGLESYMEDMGSSPANLIGCDIGINSTNVASGRHTGIRVRNHSGTAKDVLLVESAFVNGINLAGATCSTADIILQNSETIKNTTDGLIEFSAESKFAETICFDAVQTATGDGTTTVDWGLGNIMYFTFGAANETFTFTAPSGPAKLVLVLKQDGTGSRTATWPGTVLWPGNVAPTLTTTAAYVDIVTLMWDGTNYFGLFNGDFR